MGNERIVDVAESVAVLHVPLVREADAVGPRHFLAPAQLVQAVVVDEVPEVVEHAVLDEGHEGLLLARGVSGQADEISRDLDILPLVRAADVVDLTHAALEQDLLEGARDVLDEQEVARVGAGAVDRHLLAAEQLVDELGDEFLGELVRTVHVVAARDDDRHLERAVVRLSEELRAGLGRSVWVRRLKHLVVQKGGEQVQG